MTLIYVSKYIYAVVKVTLNETSINTYKCLMGNNLFESI